MSASPKPWDNELVANWLEARIEAASRDQAAADRRGYGADDEYDKAAAEEWVCRKLRLAGREGDQASFAQAIKQFLDQDDYRITGIHDDRRVERHVRSILRKIAKMAKANEGFENRLRYQ
ncbi:hypothetical protein MTR62_16275 [Novosphingobium sp. 1949]|uniref:Uncharacterized protein n=1 Tax=Novosphingobium organovorum TaxID=2930092 RepID=A0ABT0BGN3_9SPHN|nr:hypothetical protein [Novosphingobium organovorum]MCJ2184236.1 hypothetical protein [Novosphingobium organovorum]